MAAVGLEPRSTCLERLHITSLWDKREAVLIFFRSFISFMSCLASVPKRLLEAQGCMAVQLRWERGAIDATQLTGELSRRSLVQTLQTQDVSWRRVEWEWAWLTEELAGWDEGL
ncbi:hypothetical protein H1C71_027966 [Ictidomys tridecemlineatus]|nr:hypothetical protein H1C71_027966 [Ictidomys tridecemlineatus]